MSRSPASHSAAELLRLIHNLVRLGTIAEVDHSARKLRVQVGRAGEITTAWLDWPVEMGRNYRRWRPLRKGQQVVLSCPGGDLVQAKITGMLYSSALSAPSDNPDLDLIEFDDGARFQYDSAAHEYIAETGSSRVTMDRDRILLSSNGSTLELDESGIRLNGAEIHLN
ncbi:phage baseplate assembly protein V [Billgrantia gudaonensis]|uniref:Phage baseplate assembly protein V n=1 Tax=Billgrantia gudaonensis TaxID=376427 RepID=A0A1G8TIY0_9GAMM|nr:phage baseplate assembly protein V [Halomonas gudaonensis]SDJ41519.1 phage baseplate assembly protein V [Halomonas gudaonensis]